MDPLSTSASIVALIQLSGTVINYLSNVRSGPKELQQIRSETSSVLGILITLQDQIDQTRPGDPFSSALRSLNVPGGPFEQVRTALQKLDLKLAPTKGWVKLGKALKWPLEKEEIHEILNTIERQKALFSLAQQNDHIALSRAMAASIGTVHQGVDKLSVGVIDLQIGGKQKKIRQWLSAPDPSSNYNKALRSRQEGTGEWFLKTNAYRDWLSKPGYLLWLHGIPGCGKTVLSSTIIQRTDEHCQSRSGLLMLYFYFDFMDVEKQQHEKMIRSLIVQLFAQYVNIPPVLESLYSSCTNGERQPAYDSLLSTLHMMMRDFSDTYLVLDALDEGSKRKELLLCIEELARWRDLNLHILTTSRREKDIEDSMELFVDDQRRICIQSSLVDSDIRTYIHSRLQVDRDLRRWRDTPKVQPEIEDTLMGKADRMFRWAACQLDSLSKCQNLAGLWKALASLPKDLDETYGRILSRIDDEHYHYALKILQWIIYSARPLELAELAEVVVIDGNQTPRIKPENRFPEPQDILLLCPSLISIENQRLEDRSNKNQSVIVRLAHFSVKEYLVSERILHGDTRRYIIQEIDANYTIYNDCLSYLLEFDDSVSLTIENLAEFPLAKYAARYWTSHALVVERDTNFQPNLATESFITRKNAFLTWIRQYDPDEPCKEPNWERSRSDICSPLYYASRAGLFRSVGMLLDRGADIYAQGGGYGNALQAASLGGHKEVVQMLLDRGGNASKPL